MIIIICLIVLLSTFIGSIIGIGGGVIIRPVLDATSFFTDPINTNTISSFCVFIGALTSIIRHLIYKTKIDLKVSCTLGISAVCGGIIGNILFTNIKAKYSSNIITIVQSIVLIILIIFSIIYILKLKGEVCFHIKNILIILLIGFFLGTLSSFLGIGGGPFNIAFLCLFFGMDLKKASVNSIIIIVFSQASNIIQNAIKGTYNSLNVSPYLLLVLIALSIIGSLIGTKINKKIDENKLTYINIITMFLIIGINIYNILIRI